jgi:HEAT repeat protein
MRHLLFVILLLVGALVDGCGESRSRVSFFDEAGKVNIQRLEGRAIEIVREGLTDENSFVRDRAIEVVLATKRQELMPVVIQLLKDDVVAVRFAAALATGDLRYAPAEYSLRRMLSNQNENIKIVAAYSLTMLGTGDFSDVIRRLTKSKDQTVRANATMLLGKLGNTKDIELLYEVIRDSDSRDWVRIGAVKSIAMLGDETIYRTKLWPLLISKYADDRIDGIKGMAALGTMDAKTAMQTMLYDDVEEVKLCAAIELGRLGDTGGESEVLGYLSKKLSDADELDTDEWRACDWAVISIGQIGTDALIRFLPGFISSRNKLIRLSAAQSALLLAP